MRVFNAAVVVDRVEADLQDHVDIKASWEILVSQDLSVRTGVVNCTLLINH